MNHFIDKVYPFTDAHLKQFEKEMDEAGGFDLLMLKKEALTDDAGTSTIAMQANKEAYKKKYLIGVYKSLRSDYDTDVPYFFWGKMFEEINKRLLEQESASLR